MVIKSPSDTTIYRPALKQAAVDRHQGKDFQAVVTMKPSQVGHGMDILNKIRNVDMVSGGQEVLQDRDTEVVSGTDMMLKISNFVDQLHLEHEDKQLDDQQLNSQRPKSTVNALGLDEARKRMEQTIVETEKFKALVENPLGMFSPNQHIHFPIYVQAEQHDQQAQHPAVNGPLYTTNNIGAVPVLCNNAVIENRQVIRTGLTDDDFFHLTCDIDPSLKTKIECGKYVNLDKVLPKDNMFGRMVASNETKLKWIQSEGNTYLVPAKSSSRINCFRRWEQAFRVYATIYSTKKPQ